MRSFLGLGNHSKICIKDFSILTAPLVELTKPSVQVDLSINKVQHSFAVLEAMSIVPGLAIPDKPYEVV